MRTHASLTIGTRLLLASVLLAVAAGVEAETAACTPITSVPYVVTSPGIYCLTGDLSTNMATGAAIVIAASNVVLDLNGHRLGGGAAGPSTNAIGILGIQRKNVTIRNGTVRGFASALLLFAESPYTDSSGHVVEDLRVDQMTQVGIAVFSANSIVRNNFVTSTGGSTAHPDMEAHGISVIGSGNRILGNDIIDTVGTGTGSGIGIAVRFSLGLVIAGNRISNRMGMGLPETGRTRGLQIGDAVDEVLIIGNTFSHLDDGIVCYPGSTGKYRDTLSFNVGLPFGCTNAGNNN
jgi:hypothetical protein